MRRTGFDIIKGQGSMPYCFSNAKQYIEYTRALLISLAICCANIRSTASPLEKPLVWRYFGGYISPVGVDVLDDPLKKRLSPPVGNRASMSRATDDPKPIFVGTGVLDGPWRRWFSGIFGFILSRKDAHCASDRVSRVFG